jgi:hypothetical protein
VAIRHSLHIGKAGPLRISIHPLHQSTQSFDLKTAAACTCLPHTAASGSRLPKN